MPDNLLITSTPSGLPVNTGIASRSGTYSGVPNQQIAPVGLVEFSGADGAKTFTDVAIGTIIGAVGETAPGTDTASSGLNGRLQRIAQRLSSILALLPTALSAGGNLKVAIVEDTVGSTLDTDDGSLAAGQTSVALCLTQPHTYDGAAWKRGGLTPFKLISAGNTNGTSVKASAGTLGMICVHNINGAVRYLKFYNKATTPTVGTDVPVLTFPIPGNTAGAGSNIPLPNIGVSFSTGIAFAITTGSADNDNGAVAAGDIVVNLGYL